MTIVKICKVHGELTRQDCFQEKGKKDTPYYRCKHCRVASRARKAIKAEKGELTCKHHGQLSIEDLTIYGQCRECHRKSANKKRNNNREWFNEKMRVKREADPEKWKEIYKIQHQKQRVKHGKLLSLHKVCESRGITIDEYNKMLEKQNHVCAICLNPETRINGVTKEVGRLIIDHCHKTNKVRALLCHSCNAAIGHFRESTLSLSRAIRYIKTNGFNMYKE